MYYTAIPAPYARQLRSWVSGHGSNLVPFSVFALRFQILNSSPFQKGGDTGGGRRRGRWEEKEHTAFLFRAPNTILFFSIPPGWLNIWREQNTEAKSTEMGDK